MAVVLLAKAHDEQVGAIGPLLALLCSPALHPEALSPRALCGDEDTLLLAVIERWNRIQRENTFLTVEPSRCPLRPSAASTAMHVPPSSAQPDQR